MFYIKSRGRKINLRNDNVFTRCPVCGREHAVDIVETFRGGFADLYGTSAVSYTHLDVYKRQVLQL